MAFDTITFSSMGSEACAVIKRSESKLYMQDSNCDIDEIPEGAEGNDDYVWLPDKSDLDLGVSLLFRFIEIHIPDAYENVRNIFNGRGAYGRYKALLNEHELLDKWYAFEAEHIKIALLHWCEENCIVVDDA